MAGDLDGIQTAIEEGDAQAAEQLLPLVYDELRRIAHLHMQREVPGHTLQTTGLVHEAYLRLLNSDGGGRSWNGQGHFLAAAALAMRRILVDRARARGTVRRGGDRRRLDLLDLAHLTVAKMPPEALELDGALTRLAETEPEKAELVSLRFFSGLTQREAAAVLGLSPSTADRHWSFARAWLVAAMEGEL